MYDPFFLKAPAGIKRMAFLSNPHPCSLYATCQWFIFNPLSKLKRKLKVK